MRKPSMALIVATTLLPLGLSLDVNADVIKTGKVTFGTSSYNADWYLPTAQPNGLVYLQHGFQRDKKHVKDLGTSLMSKGFMVLAVSANMTGGNSSLVPQVADAFTQYKLTPPDGYTLPANVVLAGHSAGGLHLTLVGRELVARGYSGLKGLILLDPVDKDNKFASAAQAVVNQGLPLYAVTAKGSSCNASNNTEPALRALTGTSFVGFKLTVKSVHTDAEGSSSDFLGKLLCGTPQASNISALKTAAGGWANDMVYNTTTPDYYPGGAFIQSLLNSNTAYLIKP